MTVEQNSFITNQEKLLSDIMNGILPKTASTDILVGYFYFSGYKLLAENLADKQIRILVGLDIDTQITKYVREVDSFGQYNRVDKSGKTSLTSLYDCSTIRTFWMEQNNWSHLPFFSIR